MSAVYFAPNSTRPPSHPFTPQKAAKTKTKSVNPSPFTGLHRFTNPFTLEKDVERNGHCAAFM